MPASFLSGAIAGYAIAIPVGAIAILIIDLGLRRGFRQAASAGAGAASADLLYAALAMAAGAAIASFLAPIQQPLRLAAALVLLAIGARGLLPTFRPSVRAAAAVAGPPTPAAGIYLRFLGLTLLNPATVVYFAALMIGLAPSATGVGERAAFVAGVFVASLSWQTFIAGIGAVGHRRLPAGARAAFSLLGNATIIAMAVAIAIQT